MVHKKLVYKERRTNQRQKKAERGWKQRAFQSRLQTILKAQLYPGRLNPSSYLCTLVINVLFA